MVRQLLIGRRVLILDDRPEVAKAFVRAVHDAGAAVEGPYGDLTEAQAAVRGGGFDSVVMRAELRGRSTASVAVTLRTKRIPVVSVVRPDIVGELSGLSRRAAWTDPVPPRAGLADTAPNTSGLEGRRARLSPVGHPRAERAGC